MRSCFLEAAPDYDPGAIVASFTLLRGRTLSKSTLAVYRKKFGFPPAVRHYNHDFSSKIDTKLVEKFRDNKKRDGYDDF